MTITRRCSPLNISFFTLLDWRAAQPTILDLLGLISLEVQACGHSGSWEGFTHTSFELLVGPKPNKLRLGASLPSVKYITQFEALAAMLLEIAVCARPAEIFQTGTPPIAVALATVNLALRAFSTAPPVECTGRLERHWLETMGKQLPAAHFPRLASVIFGLWPTFWPMLAHDSASQPRWNSCTEIIRKWRGRSERSMFGGKQGFFPPIPCAGLPKWITGKTKAGLPTLDPTTAVFNQAAAHPHPTSCPTIYKTIIPQVMAPT